MLNHDSFDSFLKMIAPSANLQARFINTLSLLEYIGARKILKSQPEDSISLQLLAHVSEEVRHARILKKVAGQLSGGTIRGYSPKETLCGDAAKTYFQSLDKGVEEQLDDAGPRLSYLYATLLIEERALLVYPKTVASFKNDLFSSAVRAILIEEDRHLNEICDSLKVIDPIFQEQVTKMRSIETKLFDAFARSLQTEVLSSDGKQEASQAGRQPQSSF